MRAMTGLVVAVLGAGAMLAGAVAVAQERQRLPADCRQEIMRLCRAAGDREAMRTCVRERAGELSETCRSALIERAWVGRGREGRRGGERGGAQAVPAGSVLIRYGAAEAQRIRLWPAPATGESGRRPPLAIFVHGGGWANGVPEMVAEKPAWFAAHGWAFASVGYRLLPEAPVEEQAADVGRAIRQLRSEAAGRGYDPDRLLLLGHSAGAHLTALVATDPRHAGEAFAAIRGAIPIDGAAYDVVRQMQDGGRFMVRRTYEPAFGSDPARQRALSPTTHIGGPDVGDWLFLYDSRREDAVSQSALLAGGLEREGATVVQLGIVFDDRNVLQRHRRMNVEFGAPGYAGNAAVEALMRRVEGVR